ncbi:MFS transporter [Streptomyces niveus]
MDLTVLFTVSAVGSALPFALWDLAMWRVIGGFAIGMASVIGPAYIAEVSPPAYRGRLASFQQAAIVLGIALSQLVTFGILQTPTVTSAARSAAWRPGSGCSASWSSRRSSTAWSPSPSPSHPVA